MLIAAPSLRSPEAGGLEDFLIVQETEVQRGDMVCLRSHSW